MMFTNFDLKTDATETYSLASNEWYCVCEFEKAIMLIDTDCMIGGEELKTHWSYVKDSRDKDGNNGQALLDYVNNFTNKYLSDIKHALLPTPITRCFNEIYNDGEGILYNAYAFSASGDFGIGANEILAAITKNTGELIWSREYAGVYGPEKRKYAFCINRKDERSSALIRAEVIEEHRVAPLILLKKPEIDHITADNEIVLR